MNLFRRWFGKPVVVADKSAPAREKRQINWTRLQALAGPARETPKPNPVARYQPAPGVVPADQKRAIVAMDATPYDYLQSASYLGMTLENSFPGYPYLAQLAQLPEYRKITGTIASEMTRKWIKLQSTGEGDDKADRLEKLEKALERFQIRDKFRAMAEHDGFFGRGQLYLDVRKAGGAPASTDPAELQTPLVVSPAKIKKGGLIGFRVVEAMWTYPGNYNSTDPLAKDYYKPTTWYVMGKIVHDSRFVMMISNPVPDILKAAYSFGGISMSQLARPYVDNWLRTRDAVSDLVHSFSTSGLKSDLETLLSPDLDGSGGILNRVQLFNRLRDSRGLMLLNKETEDFFQFNTPLSGLDALQAQAQEQMAAVSSIPLVKLLGIQPAGLNACLPGDTVITTERGQVKICDVTTDDRVLTREGFAPLTFAGVTKHADELIEIKTASKILLCTNNHPIWLPEVGEFVPAENVRSGDRLLLIGEKQDAQKMRRQWRGVVNGGGDGAMDITPHGTHRHAVPFYFTGKFGKRIAALCRMASTFIIETETRLTTSLTIWSPCSRLITQSSITSTLGFGITAPKTGFASNAEPHSLFKNFRAEESFAPKNAHWQTDETIVHQQQNPSPYASACNAKHLSRLAERTRSFVRENVRPLVRIAGSIRTDIISLTQKDTCEPKRKESSESFIVSVRRIPAAEWVYDLTVAPGYLPEFFANDILTHNSSDGEIRVFYDHIHSLQERLFRDPLKKVLDVIQLDLDGDIDPDVTFEFEPLFQLSSLERANERKANADTDQVLIDAGVVSAEESRARIAADPDSPYASLEVTGEDAVDDLDQGEEGEEPDEVDTRGAARDAEFVESEHPRKDDGKFGSGSGTGSKKKSDFDQAKNSGGIELKKTKTRAFNGQPIATKTKLSKQEAGALGEAAVVSYLRGKGLSDAQPLNAEQNNYPVDLIAGDTLVEVKMGMVSNGPSAQKWRATIGQPGKAESEMLKSMSPEDKAAWNADKARKIMERKEKVVSEFSKKLGKKMQKKTVTGIINPDTKTIDMYEFDGFHMHIRWNHESTKAAYVGSYRYE